MWCRRHRRERLLPCVGRGCRRRANASVSASHSCGNCSAHMRHRAVVLAQLLARPGRAAVTRGVAVPDRDRASVAALADNPAGRLDRGSITLFQPATRRRANSRPVRRHGLGEETEGADGRRHMPVRSIATSLGDDKTFAGPSPAAMSMNSACLPSIIPSACNLSRCRTHSCGGQPSRAASDDAVDGPFSRSTERPAPGAGVRVVLGLALRPPSASRLARFFTTPSWPISVPGSSGPRPAQ